MIGWVAVEKHATSLLGVPRGAPIARLCLFVVSCLIRRKCVDLLYSVFADRSRYMAEVRLAGPIDPDADPHYRENLNRTFTRNVSIMPPRHFRPSVRDPETMTHLARPHSLPEEAGTPPSKPDERAAERRPLQEAPADSSLGNPSHVWCAASRRCALRCTVPPRLYLPLPFSGHLSHSCCDKRASTL